MRDIFWLSAYRAVLPLLNDDDVILAPRADWPTFPCHAKFYDGLIDVQDATVFLLGSSDLTGVKKATLADIVANWQCIHANPAFIVFARFHRQGRDVRDSWRNFFLWKIRRYLQSREFKRNLSTVYYIHVPKTGGTSAWFRLSAMVKSSVYYGHMSCFLANPPEPGEYDLVGGHFFPSALEGIIKPGDCVAGLLREPTDRFISGILHSRRKNEDPKALSPSQNAMRGLQIADYVQTHFGSFETRVQLIMLGTDHRRAHDSYTDREMLDAALETIGRAGATFAPSHLSGRFIRQLAERLSVRAPPMWNLNVNTRSDYRRFAAEIREALPAIEQANATECELYEAVCARYDAMTNGRG